jgi:hypothetical protein
LVLVRYWWNFKYTKYPQKRIPHVGKQAPEWSIVEYKLLNLSLA